jgi:hypothetical protein
MIAIGHWFPPVDLLPASFWNEGKNGDEQKQEEQIPFPRRL